MNENILASIMWLSPAVFTATAIVSWFQPNARPSFLKKMSFYVTLISIVIAAVSIYLVMKYGLIQTGLIGINQIGVSLRLDTLSVLMLSMIALLGFIVVKFSNNYLDGDKRQGAFIGRLAATIASVQLLVLSGNLGVLLTSWVLTSICLHRLLLFYYDRPGAILAARKKFIVARVGDISLLAAVVVLFNQFGTGNLEEIFIAVKSNFSAGESLLGLEVAALLLAVAAIFKSAQFPTHGWLIEVMETPTPVSALLHAGLLNAGPFLIVRMAFVMDISTYGSLTLIVIGGFTALFASIVFLTQTSIKTALGYSSIAHMGFSLLVCGLGVYPAAMLHLVAHSFYKAHAFLSSGSVIDLIRASNIELPKRIGSSFRIAFGIFLALAVYTSFALAWGIDLKTELSLLVIGAIMVLGLSRIFTAAIDSKGSIALMIRATFLAVLVTLVFFTLESGAHYILASQVPDLTQPGIVEIILTSIILLAFGSTVFIQILAPWLSVKPSYKAIAIHLRNGLYINAIFDNWVGALRVHAKQNDTGLTQKTKIVALKEVSDLDTLGNAPI